MMLPRLIGAILAILSIAASAPAAASTFFEVTKKCPVGGEKVKFFDQGSSTSWDALPDGMPSGSGPYPYHLPQCPKNGLVIYRDFDGPTVARLTPIVLGREYQALRAIETPYYLACWIARKLGDSDVAGLLIAAGWEAKNDDPESPRARRYADELIALVAAMPVDDSSFESIALRARAANALREKGDFAAAEALRSSIKIAQGAGGTSDDAADNRMGWAAFLTALSAPIARGDRSRAPIDMIGEREAAFRCLMPAVNPGNVPPLTEFETAYCARPELAEEVAALREGLRPAK